MTVENPDGTFTRFVGEPLGVSAGGEEWKAQNARIVAAIDEMGEEDPEDAPLVLEPRSSYDKCIIGLGFRFHDSFVVYEKQCILEAIIADTEPNDDPDFDPETEALEHFEFNIIGGWVGPHTPAFVTTDPDDL